MRPKCTMICITTCTPTYTPTCITICAMTCITKRATAYNDMRSCPPADMYSGMHSGMHSGMRSDMHTATCITTCITTWITRYIPTMYNDDDGRWLHSSILNTCLSTCLTTCSHTCPCTCLHACRRGGPQDVGHPSVLYKSDCLVSSLPRRIGERPRRRRHRVVWFHRGGRK